MALFETEGLILKSYNLADADKIVVILTKDAGLIRGVAKGAKRLKSKFGGSLEPFSIVDLAYLQKEERELVSIKGIELKKSFFDNAGEPLFLQKFSYLIDLLVEFAPPHDPNERLYKMSKVCLETASNDVKNLESVALYFELWLLRLAGYLPSWHKCDKCKRDLMEDEETNLQIDFHLLCADCHKSRRIWTITPQQRQIFSVAQKFSPTRFVDLTKNLEGDIKEVSTILKRVISQVLDKEIVGEKVIIANPHL